MRVFFNGKGYTFMPQELLHWFAHQQPR